MHAKPRLWAYFLVFATSIFVAVASASAETKVALVIGNSDYQNVPKLDNPSNDASDIASALERIGFAVTKGINLDKAGMRRIVSDYSKAAKVSDISIVYFAGHGIEIDKSNYLLPVDAKMQTDQAVDLEAVQLRQLLKDVATASGITLMLIDACRDNPFATLLKASGTTRSVGTGLVRVNPEGGILPGGILVSYAAREGAFALDGSARNSPYAKGLLSNLEEPGLEVSKFFRKVRDSVFEQTEGMQEPFTYGSLPSKDIYLAGLPKQSLTGLADLGIGPDLSPEEAEQVLEISAEELRQIQVLLDALGYKPGTPDGVMGANTRRAISDFQTASGLPSHGFISQETVLDLKDIFLSAPKTLDGTWRLTLDRKTVRNPPTHNDTLGFIHTMGFVDFEIKGRDINVIRSVNLSSAPNAKDADLRATIDRNGHLEMSVVINYVFFKDDSRRVFSAISLPTHTLVGQEFKVEGSQLNPYYKYQSSLKRVSEDAS